MGKKKDIPLGINISIVFIIGLLIYYFYRIITYSDYSVFFEPSARLIVIWTDIILSIILLIFGIYGLFNGRSWARYFVMFYLIWSSLWAITMIYYKIEIIEHYLFFICYILIMMYLLMSNTRTFFQKSYKKLNEDRPEKVCRYEDYTLFTREVTYKNGRKQTMYFFSKKIPEIGKSCKLPDGYMILTNSKTDLPYLKKIK